MIKTINITQDIDGTSYYEATTEFGTMARVDLDTLKKVLTWVYSRYHVQFNVQLGEVKHRIYCPDAK